MAFSFDTFAKDQKQSAIDVVDTITPSQVKQVASAYKEGLNTSPKQVINETLEQFTGVDLGQESLGEGVAGFVKGQAADLTMQLEQQILGCINTQIRDLMNKIPEIDFILNFEDRINGILSNFRNKLEQKIDKELRKLAYNKIKIHQVGLFKQKIRAKISDICPGASPASVTEVQDFNRRVKDFVNKRKVSSGDTTKTLPKSSITANNNVSNKQPSDVKGLTPKKEKMFKEDPTATQEFVQEKVKDGTTAIIETGESQTSIGDDSISSIVPTKATYVKTEGKTGPWMSDKERNEEAAFVAGINKDIANNPQFQKESNGFDPTSSNSGGFDPNLNRGLGGGSPSQEDIDKYGYEYFGLEDPTKMDPNWTPGS